MRTVVVISLMSALGGAVPAALGGAVPLVELGRHDNPVVHTMPSKQAPAPPANLPGLNVTQSTNARAIMAEVKKENMGTKVCLATIATAMAVSDLQILANQAIPGSIKYPHDGVIQDTALSNDSQLLHPAEWGIDLQHWGRIGIFQQRVSNATSINALISNSTSIKTEMDVTTSTRQFLAHIKALLGWEYAAETYFCMAELGVSDMCINEESYLQSANAICGAGGFKL